VGCGFGDRGFVIYFVSQWWKCLVLDIFVYSAAFVVGGVFTVAEDAFDLFRPFRTWAVSGAVFSGAFDTPWAMEAVGLSMPVSLAFTTLKYIALWAWRFEVHPGVD